MARNYDNAASVAGTPLAAKAMENRRRAKADYFKKVVGGTGLASTLLACNLSRSLSQTETSTPALDIVTTNTPMSLATNTEAPTTTLVASNTPLPVSPEATSRPTQVPTREIPNTPVPSNTLSPEPTDTQAPTHTKLPSLTPTATNTRRPSPTPPPTATQYSEVDIATASAGTVQSITASETSAAAAATQAKIETPAPYQATQFAQLEQQQTAQAIVEPSLTPTASATPDHRFAELQQERELPLNDCLVDGVDTPEKLNDVAVCVAENDLIDSIIHDPELNAHSTSLLNPPRDNDPRQLGQGSTLPDYNGDESHPGEYGLNFTEADLERVATIFEILDTTKNETVLEKNADGYWTGKIEFFADDSNAAFFIAAGEILATKETQTPGITNSSDVLRILKDPSRVAEIIDIANSIKNQTQERDLALSIQEGVRRDAADSMDADRILGEINPSFERGSDQFDTCIVRLTTFNASRADDTQFLSQATFRQDGRNTPEDRDIAGRRPMELAISMNQVDGEWYVDVDRFDHGPIQSPTDPDLSGSSAWLNSSTGQETLPCGDDVDVAVPLPTATLEVVEQGQPTVQVSQPPTGTPRPGETPVPTTEVTVTPRPTNIPPATPVEEPTVPVFATTAPTPVPTQEATQVPRPTEVAPTLTPSVASFMGPEIAMIGLIAAHDIKRRIRKFIKKRS